MADLDTNAFPPAHKAPCSSQDIAPTPRLPQNKITQAIDLPIDLPIAHAPFVHSRLPTRCAANLARAKLGVAGSADFSWRSARAN